MDDELLRLCHETRYRFLKVDLETCRTALEMGVFEHELGNLEVAWREEAFVKRGIETIEYFLPGVAAERRPELERQLAELKEAFEAFKALLN